MTGREAESGRKSKGRSGANKRRRKATQTGGRDDERKEATRPPAEGQFPRLDGAGRLDRLPSNAPTMVIAPSDYEHIFHEAQPGQGPSTPPTSPPAPVLVQPPKPVKQNGTTTNHADGLTQTKPIEVQVTPDGYTILGQQPDERPGHRMALPPHIVRAGNQFSRAALARVAKYLASRAATSSHSVQQQ